MAEGQQPVDYRRRVLYHALVVDRLTTMDWRLVSENLARVEASVRGDAARAAVEAWRELLHNNNIEGIRRALTEDSDHADLMRIVSPFAGTLSEDERLTAIRQARHDLR